MPPLIQALMIFVPFLLIVAGLCLYFAGQPERQARVRHWIAGTVMSRAEADPTLDELVDERDRQLAPGAGDTMAEPSTAVNDQLTGDMVDSAFAMLPAEAREIVIFEARAQAIADLQRKNLITNLAKVIEAVYHTPRASSSRPESTYQKAKARVEELVSARPMWVSDLRAKIDEEVEQGNPS